MEIKQDLDFDHLRVMAWSGAVDTLKSVESHEQEDELMDLLEETFAERVPTLTEVNDFLWFESDFILEQLGIPTEDMD